MYRLLFFNYICNQWGTGVLSFVFDLDKWLVEYVCTVFGS